jgi:hypothetical protein
MKSRRQTARSPNSSAPTLAHSSLPFRRPCISCWIHPCYHSRLPVPISILVRLSYDRSRNHLDPQNARESIPSPSPCESPSITSKTITLMRNAIPNSHLVLDQGKMANLGVPIKLLHEALGHVVTCELKTGQVSLARDVTGSGFTNCVRVASALPRNSS